MDAPDQNWLLSNAATLAVPLRFYERGVSAPFTTPALFGARLRMTSRAAATLEVLLPNPSERSGWFVLPWTSVMESYHPTLGDQEMVAGVAAGTPPESLPGRVRAAAVAMALGGMGGRASRRAASALRAHSAQLELELRAQLDSRAAGAAAHAPRFLNCGLDGEDGLLSSQLRAVAVLAQSLCEAADQAPLRADRQAILRLAARAAGLLQPARALRDAARAALLGRLSHPVTMLQPCPELSRPEWLLDGWGLLAAWLATTPREEQPALLRRVSLLVPPLPPEAWSWPCCAALAEQEGAGSGLGRGRGAATGHTIAAAETALARWLLPEPAPA